MRGRNRKDSIGMKKIKVTIWNEFYHEVHNETVKKIYPDGIHKCLGEFLGKEADMEIQYATLEMPEHGLTEEVLNNTDVLIWWGHVRHDDVQDEIVQRVYRRVQDGMGLVLLHSAHASKIFRKLCGTDTHMLKWGDEMKEIIWTVNRSHPIAEGLTDEKIVLEEEEIYGEPFSIPDPDELVFISWFECGAVFRSGCCYRRGKGKIFYFQPGHETVPTYHQKPIQKVITNAVRWAKPADCPELVQGYYGPEDWVVSKEK